MLLKRPLLAAPAAALLIAAGLAGPGAGSAAAEEFAPGTTTAVALAPSTFQAAWSYAGPGFPEVRWAALETAGPAAEASSEHNQYGYGDKRWAVQFALPTLSNGCFVETARLAARATEFFGNSPAIVEFLADDGVITLGEEGTFDEEGNELVVTPTSADLEWSNVTEQVVPIVDAGATHAGVVFRDPDSSFYGRTLWTWADTTLELTVTCPVLDSDGDGVPDDEDNCPTLYTKKQGPDSDGDGVGNRCDRGAGDVSTDEDRAGGHGHAKGKDAGKGKGHD